MTAGRSRYYLLPVAWMILLFYFSGDAGSFSRTSAIMIPIIRFFFPQMAPRDLFLLVRIIRKIFHFVDYGILAGLWFWALNGGKLTWSSRVAAIALSISVVYGGLDELHQWFVETRTASLIDVAIDSAGAAFALVALFATGGEGRGNRALAFFLWWFTWGVVSVALILAPFRGTGSVALNLGLILIGGAAAGISAVAISRRRSAESRRWYH